MDNQYNPNQDPVKRPLSLQLDPAMFEKASEEEKKYFSDANNNT